MDHGDRRGPEHESAPSSFRRFQRDPLNPRRSLRVLLAEDSPVNQKVAVTLLEKWGHRVTVAGTGKRAVADLEQGTFDLIIMDVQMPEMDGLEATTAIRQRERSTGEHIPIVALTAHAMKGDRQRCLAAGMDAYVTKPVHTEELFDVIEQITGGSTPHDPNNREREQENESSESTSLDWNAALAAVDGDQELLRQVIEVLLEECPLLLSQVRQATEQNDAATLRRAAHTLKGSLRLFGPTSQAELAYELEKLGAEGQLQEGSNLVDELAGQLSRLVAVLEAFLRDGGETGGR
ncbi:MAG: response regulator [Pirellulales bacterium]